MLSYILKCKKDTENVDTRVSKSSNGKTMLPSKYAACGSKKATFMKEQGLSNILGIETPLINIPLLG